MALIEAINEVPQAIVAVYTPRVIELYGKTESIIACMRLSLKPMLWGLAAIFLIIVAGFLGLPLIVPLLMPKYIDAVPTMCLLLLISGAKIIGAAKLIAYCQRPKNTAKYGGLCWLGLFCIVGHHDNSFGVWTYRFGCSNTDREER